jgi:hypothetical protein
MYPDVVRLLVSTTTTSVERIVKKSYTVDKEIRANVQPYGGELAIKDYGITESGITHRMFCPIHLTDEHTQVEWNGKRYAVLYVATHRNKQEVVLSPIA